MSVTNIKHGVYGGLAGGVLFGAMMAMMGMLPMIGNMVGIPSAWVGFVVHLMISATIGGSFAVLLDASGQRGGVASGLAYGFVWWILGPEPYRVCRRAFSLRGWSHVTTESVFPRSTRASGAAGPRARG